MPPQFQKSLVQTRSPLVQGGVLVAFLALVAVVAALGGMATSAGQDGWYASLAQPPLNPPGWVFGPVWTVLYVMMAVAAWRIWRQPPGSLPTVPSRTRALALWGVQLVLNLAWSVLFFALKSPVAALGDLILLAVVLAATTWAFHARDRVAGLLMVPYLLWVLFAGYLNAGIVVVN